MVDVKQARTMTALFKVKLKNNNNAITKKFLLSNKVSNCHNQITWKLEKKWKNTMNFPIQHPMKEARSVSVEDGVVFVELFLLIQSKYSIYINIYLSELGMLLTPTQH